MSSPTGFELTASGLKGERLLHCATMTYNDSPVKHIHYISVYSNQWIIKDSVGSESLGELEKAVETLASGSCSHSISRSPKISTRVSITR